MKILDSQGRLFGKISILDLGAALVILFIIAGIFLVPGKSGTSIAQNTVGKQPIEVDVLVRGLSVLDPQTVFNEFEQTKATDVIIRNQPYGRVEIKEFKKLPRNVLVPQPDGSVAAKPDPRIESQYSLDMLITLGGKAQVTKSGAVLGNSKVKIGTPIELDGRDYNFRGSIIDVRVQK